MDDQATSFDIQIDFEDSDLREQIESGSEDPMGWITKIQADETVLVVEDDSSGMREYLTSFFAGTLQGLIEALSGDRSYFTAPNGPLWIVFEPVGSDAIRYTHAYKRESIDSPSTRRSFEPSVVIASEPLVGEVRARTEEFLRRVEEWNPELATASVDYRGVREDLQTLNKAVDTYQTK